MPLKRGGPGTGLKSAEVETEEDSSAWLTFLNRFTETFITYFLRFDFTHLLLLSKSIYIYFMYSWLYVTGR